MNWAIVSCRNHLNEGVAGWNRFWFQPQDPATLGLIRVLAGTMLFYTHLVWSLRLEEFFGPSGMVPMDVVQAVHVSQFAWSVFPLFDSPWLLWTFHVFALVIFALFAIGLGTRWSSILAFLITVSYVNRVPVALFGLDQINGMLALYLMLGPSGGAFSVDRLLARRRAGGARLSDPASVSANIAIRLIQIHLCVIYLFAGCGKLFGESWWSGTAIWLALANYEYQSLDMTWLATWPLLINLMTHVTLIWEISYSALIWPRWTRPFVLALAIPLHVGIAVAMGMITFGLVMLIANLAFVSPSLIRAVFGDRVQQAGRAGGPNSEFSSTAQTENKRRRRKKRREK